MASRAFQEWWDRFKVTGDICPVRLAMLREEIRTLLGDPDETGGTSQKHRTPAIWKYDDLEFHFDLNSENRLWLIYMERDGITNLSTSSKNRPESKDQE
jgi:hypothetical protein